MQHVSGTHWQVESDSSPKLYDVMLHVPHCTCQGWARNINTQRKKARLNGEDETLITFECKHIKAARAEARRVNLPDGTSEQEERLEELKRQETEREAAALLNQFRVKPDPIICDECGADVSPVDGGEPGRHDDGCSHAPLTPEQRDAAALIEEFRKKS